MKQFDQTFPTPPPSFGEDFNIQPINQSPTAIPPAVTSQNGYNQSPIPVQNGYKQSLTPNQNRYSPPQIPNQNGYNHIAVANQNEYSPTPVTNQNGYNTPVTNQNGFNNTVSNQKGFNTPVTNSVGFNSQINSPKFNTQVTNPNGFNTQVTSPNGYNSQLTNQNGFNQVANQTGFSTTASSPNGYNNSVQSSGTRVPPTNNPNYSQPLSHIPQGSSQEFPNGQLHTGINPKFPPQTFDIPDINITGSSETLQYNQLKPVVHNSYNYNNYPPNGVRRTPYSNFYPPHPALTTISPDIRAQLGFKHPMAAPGGSPGSNHTSPGRESSEDSDDSLPLAQLVLRRNKPVVTPGDHATNQEDTWSVAKLALKRSAPVASPPQGNNSNSGAPTTKKAKGGKKKKKRDPNEPQKPVSAYALFFRDTQAAIKGQNPNASFGEVSKIVASMWDSLDEDQKNAYKKKTETAKKEYLKQLAAYRASLVSKGAMDPEDPFPDKGAPPVGGGRPLMANPRMSPMQDPGMGYPPPPGMMGHPPNPGMNHPSPEQQPTSPPHMMQMHDQQAMHSGYPDGMGSPGNPMCVRNGCHNTPVDNPGWDNEYCSSGCVVDHCRDVFTAWVASRQNTYASVK